MTLKIELMGFYRPVKKTFEEYLEGWLDFQIEHYQKYQPEALPNMELPEFSSFMVIQRKYVEDTFLKHAVDDPEFELTSNG